jgi:hypothetical protein
VTQRRVWRVLAVIGVASTGFVLAGCNIQLDMATPECTTDVETLSTMTLIAQSVHDASLVPCLQTIPAGWQFLTLDVRQNRTQIKVASDRGGDRALEVTLTPQCDVADAVPIPSDEPRARRYEQVQRLQPTYRGARFYVFDGGCVTYRFQLDTAQPSVLLNEATLMMGFLSRSDLREAIRRQSNGVIENGP